MPRLIRFAADTENFYAITRHNWSSCYVMAVIDLAEAVSREMQNKPRTAPLCRRLPASDAPRPLLSAETTKAHEATSTKKTAADQVDSGQTCGQANAAFGQPGDRT